MRFTALPLTVLLAVAGCHHGGSGLVDTSDGGSDSGVLDAGVLDAGLDAGPFDGGVPDSGLADSGPVDSGVPDAGLVDAGHDAGPQCQPDASVEFGVPSMPTGTTVANWFAVADFNHDGIEDLLVVGWYGGTNPAGTTLYYGLADGGLAAGPFFPEISEAFATAGDLNGDGWADFVTTCDVSPSDPTADPYLDIEINETDGSFAGTRLDTAPLGPITTVYQTSLADLDSDGRADIVACTSNGIVIYFDDGGAPSFGQPVWVDPWDGGTSDSLSYSCDSLVVADLDGDGNADLASVSGSAPSPSEPSWAETEEYLVIRLGIGDGGFSRTSRELIYTTPTVAAIDLAATDVDGDGLLDLVWWNDLGIAVRLNRGGGVFETEVDVGTTPPIDLSTEPPNGWGGNLIVADFNGDGLPDVVTTVVTSCDYGPGPGAWLFLNNGCGGFALGSPLTLDPSVLIGNAWRPAGQLPSLIVATPVCSNDGGGFSFLPNLTPDAG